MHAAGRRHEAADPELEAGRVDERVLVRAALLAAIAAQYARNMALQHRIGDGRIEAFDEAAARRVEPDRELALGGKAGEAAFGNHLEIVIGPPWPRYSFAPSTLCSMRLK